MKVKLILPALTEAMSPYFRPIKYSLFPPLGLATLAAYLRDEDQIELQDEHVEPLRLDDRPDLVVIQVYVTSAYRAYRLADRYRLLGSYVALGGLHVTSLPEEAARHADSVFLGPGEDTWPTFLADYRAGCPKPLYRSTVRTLERLPPIRRDLIKRHLYLVPNSIVVSRGCPHVCDFCYKNAFFEGGRGFYTQRVDQALAEIERLPGRHLYFLDDHLFGDVRFAAALFDGMRGMTRGVSSSDDDLRAVGDRVLGRLSRFLSLELDPARCFPQVELARKAAARGLRGRLEEVRADVGLDHTHQAHGGRSPGARGRAAWVPGSTIGGWAHRRPRRGEPTILNVRPERSTAAWRSAPATA